METYFLILPGYGNSGIDHWQTYFESKLANCTRVQQKSWDKPVCEDWIAAINKAVNQYEAEKVVLISHSMGGIAIAHWAKMFPTKIKGAMIVAPPDLEKPWKDYNLQSFIPIPTILFPFPSLIVASTNDLWTSQDRSSTFAKNWGSKLVFIADAGHINAESGFGIWDEGLNLLKNEFLS